VVLVAVGRRMGVDDVGGERPDDGVDHVDSLAPDRDRAVVEPAPQQRGPEHLRRGLLLPHP